MNGGTISGGQPIECVWVLFGHRKDDSEKADFRFSSIYLGEHPLDSPFGTHSDMKEIDGIETKS